MKLARDIDWDELTGFAKHLAEEAAKAILPYFREDVAVEAKTGAVWDPVTEADRGAERVMRKLIEERYPDHGILGEEYGAKNGSSGFTWVLDPVDGTRAFICGMPTWATLIGLSHEGAPKVGIMSQPFVGEVFFGNPQGAWVDYRGSTKPLRVRSRRPLSDAVLTTTAPELYRTEMEKGVLQRLTGATRLTRYGGDAYFFCVMASGQVDIAMDARMEPYDIAPLLPIVHGAGGVACTWDRGDPAMGGNVITASSTELLEEALAVIHS